MADESYFEDASDPESPAEDKMEGGEEGESKTALVPTSVFGDPKPKPGDTCTFKVVKCMEDECQIEYVSRGTKSEDMGESDMPSKDEMAGMMEDMG